MAKDKKKMKVIIYIRTSTTDQNPENQLKDCESINRWGEYKLFQDQQSAWLDHARPGFDALKRVVSKGTEHLIVWDLDRLFRNRKRLVEFFQYCKTYGCKVHSFRQQWLEDLNNIPQPFNEIMFNLMLQIMGWLAEEESNKRSARVKASVRKKNDITVSYKGNKWGRKRISTQKRNIIKQMREQGLSMRSIANDTGLSLGVVHKTLAKN